MFRVPVALRTLLRGQYQGFSLADIYGTSKPPSLVMKQLRIRSLSVKLNTKDEKEDKPKQEKEAKDTKGGKKTTKKRNNKKDDDD
jgi:hypothetical protein